MKKILSRIGIALGILVVILLVVFYLKGNALVTHKYSITPANVVIPTDAALIAHGKQFAVAICEDCHLSDLSGKNLINLPIAQIDSANLTSGQGGAGVDFKDVDWVRALRDGVDNQGRALMVMPAQNFWNFNDQDLGDIIAYVKSVAPVDKQHKDPQSNFLGKIMVGAGLFGKDVVPASEIAHTQRPVDVPVGVTAQYGKYLVNVSGCHDCHGAVLAGGRSAKPGSKKAPNLTPGGDLKTWSSADFINTLHTGVTPIQRKLDPNEMPWKSFSTYPDDELTAIFLYLQSLPAVK